MADCKRCGSAKLTEHPCPNCSTQPQRCGGSGEPWKERAGQPFSEWELGVIRTYAARSLDALSAPEAGSEVGQRWLDLLNKAALLASRLVQSKPEPEVGEKRRWTCLLDTKGNVTLVGDGDLPGHGEERLPASHHDEALRAQWEREKEAAHHRTRDLEDQRERASEEGCDQCEDRREAAEKKADRAHEEIGRLEDCADRAADRAAAAETERNEEQIAADNWEALYAEATRKLSDFEQALLHALHFDLEPYTNAQIEAAIQKAKEKGQVDAH